MQIIALIISSVAFVVSVVVAVILKQKSEEAERMSSVYKENLEESEKKIVDAEKRIRALEKRKDDFDERKKELEKGVLALVQEKMEAQDRSNRLAAKSIGDSLEAMGKNIGKLFGRVVPPPANEQSSGPPGLDPKRAEEGPPPPS